MGAHIGDGTRLISSVAALGSEPYLITIGKDCLISSNVFFFTHDGGVKVLNSLNYFEKKQDKVGPIVVGNNCFIGHGAIILPNVTIGDNCIVGAGSVVCKNVPANSVCAGIPAKVICSIDAYYQKNANNFFPTPTLPPLEKQKYLENVFRK
jgi:acetyltransferase-like isoleucine patch superfamily enzyme